MGICSNFVRVFLLMTFSAFGVAAQQPAQPEENLNFVYSQNPPAKTKTSSAPRMADESENTEKNTAKSPIEKSETAETGIKPRFESVARMTREIAKDDSLKNLKPTEVYKVGVNDVLFVSLQDSKSNYYTVLNDGSIDYPLAGGFVTVSGLTVGEIEELLRSKIQLYENPDVSVGVREFASHRIDVIGMAENAGKHFLQREAMPLYVIRAQAQAEPGADIAVIKRTGVEEIVVGIDSPEFDETLVYTGDVVEFASSSVRAAQHGYVYVGGSVGKIGRVGFLKGMTLTQAIVAAGGVADKKAGNAIVRRKNAAGFLESKAYTLSDINNGTSIDPVLEPGDLIEVGQ